MVAVRLVFLGKLADLAGASGMEIAGTLDWNGLLCQLPGLLGEAAQTEKVKIAVNGRIVPDKASLTASDGDEIALLPPVSGG